MIFVYLCLDKCQCGTYESLVRHLCRLGAGGGSVGGVEVGGGLGVSVVSTTHVFHQVAPDSQDVQATQHQKLDEPIRHRKKVVCFH